VETYGLSYTDLKELVRNSMEYSFLPGPSLWDDKGGYARFVAACLNEVPGEAEPPLPCASFLAGSEKAAQQWELERRFQAFEAGL
jgi:adenosine deaminase